MKSFLTVLLATVLYAEQAHALICYMCNAQTSNDLCMVPDDCPDDAKYCSTTVSMNPPGSSSGIHITKMCMRMCQETSQSHGNMSTTCCQTDYCNHNSAATSGISSAVLVAAFLASSLHLLSWAGP
ncbi:PREDICTED: lymphocyte antigen 6E-like [Gavialis gangeticus]|uniref:lymphocyte antigen 6E-like n=1 Tax=Gavialis gangeticus TaxID=94835 RepID=UPI00092F61DD|nr:PREDICTED: lymphocyte antigen 6E-like [Gavialis gangeticus]